jgi:conjugative relaxase-like TrwC/TraI family protein
MCTAGATSPRTRWFPCPDAGVVVVLSIGKLTLGQQNYYLDQVASGIEDYYAGAGEAQGRWLASASVLGLEGVVDADALRAVLSALDPTNSYKLVPTNNRKIAGFDLTFSAPKSVSVLWALGDPGVNLAVRDAHEAAVAAAVDYMERHAAFGRRGHGGLETMATEGFIAAGFRHRTSRNADPQLHTHVLVANVALGADGRWGTLDARHLYKQRMAAGHLYQVELRHRLTRTLGVSWTPVERGTAEVAGMPPVVLRAFSTRRIEIEEELAIAGMTSPAAAAVAALSTRKSKTDIDTATLFERWHHTAAELGFGSDAVRLVLGHAGPLALTGDHENAIAEYLVGPNGLTENTSVFARTDAVRAIANLAPTGLDAAAIEHHADRLLAHREVVPVGEPGVGRYSTRELLAIETRTVNTAVARVDTGAGECSPSYVQAILRHYPTLADEQADLVQQLTTSGNGVDVVVAAAGTGKTFAMGVAHDVWLWNGFHVQGVALAGRAAAELEHSARIPSRTIAAFTNRLDENPLTDRDVLIVDEAGMVGTRALAPILDAAARANAKVVLVGDYHQLPEINAGGMLRGLAARIEPVVLIENRRQREPWERDALIELRHGDVAQALAAYLEHDRIDVAPNADAARTAVVERWLQATSRGEQAIMLAPTWDDVDRLNADARQRLVEQGVLTGPAVVAHGLVFQVGDRVAAQRNDYQIDIRNGHTGTITAIDEHDRSLTMRLETGAQRRIPAEYIDAGHLDHGYAITIHKAQGLTVDRAYTLGGDQLDRELGYVAMSRGRNGNRLQLIEPDSREQAHRLEAAPSAAIDALTDQLRHEHAHSLAIDD